MLAIERKMYRSLTLAVAIILSLAAVPAVAEKGGFIQFFRGTF